MEQHLTEVIKTIFSAESVHIQAEKNGISNGRVDLVVYDSTRSLVHFELIASNSNNHVFRDTTSLLNSMADTKLAILIDEDLDPDVATAFFRALPLREIPTLKLRELLLKENETILTSQLRELLSRAAFRSGSIRKSDFHCFLDKYEVKIYDKIRVSFHKCKD